MVPRPAGWPASLRAGLAGAAAFGLALVTGPMQDGLDGTARDAVKSLRVLAFVLVPFAAGAFGLARARRGDGVPGRVGLVLCLACIVASATMALALLRFYTQ